MIELVAAIGSAFAIAFVAELGDKTQLIALGLGARHRLAWVIAGITLGYAAAGVVAVIVGGLLGAALPERPVAIIGGLVFLVFAVVTWRDAGDEADDEIDDPGEPDDAAAGQDTADRPSPAGRATIWSIAGTIAIAELGDKTQIATATLATRSNPVAVWIGATLGMAASGSVGAIAGQRLGQRVDPRLIGRAAALMFAVFGVLMIAGALR